MTVNRTAKSIEFQNKIRRLQARLREAEEMLRVIRETDAIAANGNMGEQASPPSGAESIYRLIVETMKDAAFTATLAGKILYCNAQFCEFVKQPPGMVIGRPLDQFVLDDERDSVAALLAEARKRPVRQRLVLRAADGGSVPAHVSANILNEPDQLSICVVANDPAELENSTELIQRLRKQQEALRRANRELELVQKELQAQNQQLSTSHLALQEAQARYRDLFEAAPDGYVVTDPDGRIQEINQAVIRLFGEGAPGCIGKPFWTLLPASEKEPFVNLLQKLKHQDEQLSNWEVPMLRPDGSLFWASITSAPSRGEHGSITGVRWMIHDISSRKEMEKSLRENEERLRMIVENSRDGINLLDLKSGRYIFVSPAQARITGFSVQELLDMSAEEMLERVHPEDRESLHSQQELAAAGQETGPAEYRWKVKSGEYRWFSDSRSLIRDAKGEPIALVEVCRDITVRRLAELRLQELNETLEKRVAERTAELNKRAEQLRHLATELTLSEQRERQRLAIVLHDGLQQMLVAAKFSAALLERGGNVKEQAAEISGLIDDCIQTSRSLTAELSPPILYKGGLLPALEWLVQWMKEKHGLTVTLSAREPIGRLPEQIDVLLFQSIRELLFNVVKHAGTRTAQIEVARTDSRLQVEVADKGMGFDVSRLHAAESNPVKMGLFSIRERIGYLGGSMEIESAPGKGARFRLITPEISSLRPSHEAATHEGGVSVASLPLATGPASAGQIRVVLIDDHMVMRQGLAGLLQSVPDMQVVGEASDGASGLTLVRQVRPDVVLMDISMPGMDGIEATRAIHEEMPNVKIVGLSMFQEGEQAASIREAGAVAYVTKSGPSLALIETIRSCVRETGGRER